MIPIGDERRTDHQTRGRIDEIFDEVARLEEKFDARADRNADAAHRAFAWVIAAIVVFGVGMSVAIGIFRHENNQRVQDLQQSRRESAGLSCLETNARHDNALIEFDKLLLRAVKIRPAEYPKSLPTAVRLDRYDRALQFAFTLPRVRRLARFEQIKTSAVTTPLLINALVPRRDCAAYVRHLIK